MKDKFQLPLFPIFFAIYPIWALLAVNPGEIVPAMAIRFSIIFSVITWLMIWFVYLVTHDRLRSLLIGTLAVWSV